MLIVHRVFFECSSSYSIKFPCNVEDETEEDDSKDNSINDLSLPGSVYAVAAKKILRMIHRDQGLVPSGEPNRFNGYKHVIGPAVPYLRELLLFSQEKIARAHRLDCNYYIVIKSKE